MDRHPPVSLRVKKTSTRILWPRQRERLPCSQTANQQEITCMNVCNIFMPTTLPQHLKSTTGTACMAGCPCARTRTDQTHPLPLPSIRPMHHPPMHPDVLSPETVPRVRAAQSRPSAGSENFGVSPSAVHRELCFGVFHGASSRSVRELVKTIAGTVDE